MGLPWAIIIMVGLLLAGTTYYIYDIMHEAHTE